MPEIITVGPFAMATDRVIAIGAIWAFLILMSLIGRHSDQRQATSRAAWIAIITGLVVSRLAYVSINWAAFAADWTTIFAFWQGGFELWPGIIAAGLSLRFTLRGNHIFHAIIALAICAVGFSGLQTLNRQPTRPLPTVGTLPRLDGQMVSLDTYRGKPFVINLWATWCPPCRRELPMLAEVAKTSPVPILLIDQGEDADRVRTFLARQKIPGNAVLRDPEGAISNGLGSGVFPTTLFINSRGVITASHMGEISRAALLARIAQLQKDSK